MKRHEPLMFKKAIWTNPVEHVASSICLPQGENLAAVRQVADLVEFKFLGEFISSLCFSQYFPKLILGFQLSHFGFQKFIDDFCQEQFELFGISIGSTPQQTFLKALGAVNCFDAGADKTQGCRNRRNIYQFNPAFLNLNNSFPQCLYLRKLIGVSA